MFYGLSIVYIQIFLRKIREGKNFLIYYYNYKLKRKYFLFKNIIMRYSLFFFFLNNYNLIVSLANITKKIFNIIFIFKFIIINLKINIILKIFFIYNQILFDLINNIKKISKKK
jgi:hypothetical protein